MGQLECVVEHGTKTVERIVLTSLFEVVDYKVAWGSPKICASRYMAVVSSVCTVFYTNLANSIVLNVLALNSLGPGVS